MKNIHEACVQYGTEADGYVNYVKGANVAGFILAVPSNQDKRCKNIYPTEKAYDIQKKMDNYRKKIDRRLTIGMSKKEIAALEKMLDRVLYNISDP